jgi:hypothetical protein
MPRKRDPSLPPPIPRRRTDAPVFRKDCVLRYSCERPIIDTFHYLLEKYPRETWEGLSWRKQTCLFFLHWFVNPTEDNLLNLVERTKAWRKCDRRVGGKRTLLEAMIRKRLFKKAKQIEDRRKGHILGKSPENLEHLRKLREKQKEEKKGFYNPDTQTKAAKDRARAMMGPQGEWWVVTSPWGQVYHVQGLREFCEENGLNRSHLGRTAKVPGTYHKGWMARKKVADWPVER